MKTTKKPKQPAPRPEPITLFGQPPLPAFKAALPLDAAGLERKKLSNDVKSWWGH